MGGSSETSLTERRTRSLFFPVLLTIGLFLSVISFAGIGVLRNTVIHLENVVAENANVVAKLNITPSPSPSPRRQCDFPIVYNKPPKTASTKIQEDILSWARRVNRPAYKCSPILYQASVQMRECIPADLSGCAIIATHVILSPVMTSILERKIGKFVLVTSTRHPRTRILSTFLQKVRAKRAESIDRTELKDFLRRFPPWETYNYHTGANRRGTCPMTLEERKLLPDMVNKADIVIDADLKNITQAILQSRGLFMLSQKSVNVRHSKDLVLDQEEEELINNVTCVENEIFRLYRLRMASLYEKATGRRCLSNARNVVPTCF